MTLHVYLFGGLTIELDGVDISDQIQTKSALLLAYLIQERQVQQRETVASLFWEESTQKQAYSNLRRTLTQLRKHVGDFLEITRETIGINPEATLWVDTWAWQAEPTGDPNIWEQRAALYQGRFLHGLFLVNSRAFGEWVQVWQRVYHEQALSLQQTLLTHYDQIGQDERAIEQALFLLHLDPLLEQTTYQLMVLLARNGRLTEALAHYETCQQILANELGVHPQPHLTSLYDRLRLHGERPLFPLPQPPTSFIGRHEEIATLVKQFQDPTCRLVTLTGLGGMGKTRIALQLAHRLQFDFVHGVAFVPLASLNQPDLLVATIIDSLQLLLNQETDLEKQLLAYLRPKQLLLILDNAEHLLGDNGRLLSLIRAILRQAPQVKLLVTSREPLYLQAEQRLALAGLEAGVPLFVARAKATQSDFTVEKQVDIEAICDLVNGSPLAIELAAGWVSMMSPAEILEALHKSIDLLATPLHDMPTRHRSLERVIETIWQKLPPAEQTLFAQLGVFQGLFSQTAVQKTLGMTLWQIRAFVDKGLLQSREDGYYTMPHALHTVAKEKLHRLGLASETQEKLSHYYLNQLTTNQITSLIQHEYSNLRLALLWVVQQQAWGELQQAITILTRFYQTQPAMSHQTTLFQAAWYQLGQAPQRSMVHQLLTQLEEAQPILTIPDPKRTQPIAGRYQITGTIGEGGMGIVYQVWDPITAQELALKQITLPTQRLQFMSRPDSDLEKDLKLALAREFQILAGLRHPHIISVLDYGFADGNPFFTMPYLAQAHIFLEIGSTLSLDGKLQVVGQLLQALLYLHRRGVIHRDLKPSNILVIAENGQHTVKVLDFGLSSYGHDSFGSSGGTPTYVAPEVWLENDPTVASDLFAVGVLTFQLLTGHHPFGSMDDGFFLDRVLDEEPDWGKLDLYHPDLVELLQHLLLKEPTQRATALEAFALLRRLQKNPLPESEAIRESALQAAAFVGREAELAQLQTALANTKAGQGQAILIGGESGVGKSRLMEELRIQALVAGFLVLQGQAAEGGSLPFQLWRPIVRRLLLMVAVTDFQAGVLQEIVPDVAGLLGRDIPSAPELTGRAGQQRLVLTIIDLLRAVPQPVLLLLEDLQWTVESLVPLKQLLLVYEQLPTVMVVGNYRHDEAPQLPETLPQMASMRLDRLSAQDIAQLSEAMLGTVGANPTLIQLLQQESEGNTFFMVEIMRALAEESGQLNRIGQEALPDTVFTGGMKQLMRRRLGKVNPHYQEMQTVAAVIGRQIDTHLLAHLYAPAEVEAWLAEASTYDLVTGQESGWQFAHDKLRETLVADLPEEQHAATHRQIAEAIEVVYIDDPAYQEALMTHWREAGNLDQELRYLNSVAKQLIEIQGEYTKAQALLEQALTRLPDEDPRTIPLLNWVARQYNFRNQHSEGQEIAEKAYQLARQMEQTKEEARSLHILANMSYIQGEYERAKQFYQQSLTISQQLADQQGIALNLRNLGQTFREIGNYGKGFELGQQSLVIFEQLGDQRDIAETLNSLGVHAMRQGNDDQAIEFYQQGLTLFQQLGDQLMTANALNNLALIATSRGHYNQATKYHQQSLTITQKLGNQYDIAVVLSNLGITMQKQRKYDQATELVEQSLVICQQLKIQVGIALNLYRLGNIEREQKHYERAIELLERSLAIFEQIGIQVKIADTLMSLGFAQIRQGDYQEAIAQFSKGLNIYHQLNLTPKIAGSLIGFVGVWIQMGKIQQAGELLGLVKTSQIELHDWQSELDDVRSQLQTQLSPDELDACLKEGAELDLETVVQALLAEFGSENH